MNQRLMAILATGTAAVLATAGCSGSDSDPESSAEEADAAPGGAGDPLEFVAEAVNNTGSADSYTAVMTMSGNIDGVSVDSSADIEYAVDPEPTMRMVVEDGETSGDILVRDNEMLMSDGGPGWLRIDISEFGLDIGNQDPASEVEKLLAAQDVEETGAQDIDGVATTGYVGSYSTEEALAEVDDEAMADAAQEAYTQAGVDTVDFEVFIDEDGMPRRLTNSLGDMMESTFDFTSFNEGATIDYPSDDQIQDFGDDMLDVPEIEEP